MIALGYLSDFMDGRGSSKAKHYLWSNNLIQSGSEYWQETITTGSLAVARQLYDSCALCSRYKDVVECERVTVWAFGSELHVSSFRAAAPSKEYLQLVEKVPACMHNEAI